MTGGQPSQPLIWIARRGRWRYCTDRFLQVATILSKNSSPQLPTKSQGLELLPDGGAAPRARAAAGPRPRAGTEGNEGPAPSRTERRLTSSHRRASVNAAWKSHSASSLPSMASSERAGGGRRSAGRGRGSGRCHSAASF